MARCAAGGPADVLVTHDCPSGVPIPGIDDGILPPSSIPPEEIALAIEHRAVLRRVFDACRPGLLVQGHYHVAYEAPTPTGHAIGLDCDGTTFERNLHLHELP